ncbi:MAG: hypothetical protein HUK28_03305 [Methanobrevibacter sp.]|nr:hypothetical protein [Methanobrevibacter sp.]
MPKSKIKFYQESQKKINDNGEVEVNWKIINDSEFTLNKVEATSQFMNHSFDDIKPQSKAEFKFYLKIPSIDLIKEDFGEDATVSNPFIIGGAILTFTIKNDTFDMKSNSLEVPF